MAGYVEIAVKRASGNRHVTRSGHFAGQNILGEIYQSENQTLVRTI